PPPTSTLFPYTTLFRSPGLNSSRLPPLRSYRPSVTPSMRISWLKSCPPLIDPENVSPTVPGRLVKMKVCSCRPPSPTSIGRVSRSEEHTSELQSLAYLV